MKTVILILHCCTSTGNTLNLSMFLKCIICYSLNHHLKAFLYASFSIPCAFRQKVVTSHLLELKLDHLQFESKINFIQTKNAFLEEFVFIEIYLFLEGLYYGCREKWPWHKRICDSRLDGLPRSSKWRCSRIYTYSRMVDWNEVRTN